jgi:hypothetical protein
MLVFLEVQLHHGAMPIQRIRLWHGDSNGPPVVDPADKTAPEKNIGVILLEQRLGRLLTVVNTREHKGKLKEACSEMFWEKDSGVWMLPVRFKANTARFHVMPDLLDAFLRHGFELLSSGGSTDAEVFILQNRPPAHYPPLAPSESSSVLTVSPQAAPEYSSLPADSSSQTALLPATNPAASNPFASAPLMTMDGYGVLPAVPVSAEQSDSDSPRPNDITDHSSLL